MPNHDMRGHLGFLAGDRSVCGQLHCSLLCTPSVLFIRVWGECVGSPRPYLGLGHLFLGSWVRHHRHLTHRARPGWWPGMVARSATISLYSNSNSFLGWPWVFPWMTWVFLEHCWLWQLGFCPALFLGSSTFTFLQVLVVEYQKRLCLATRW